MTGTESKFGFNIIPTRSKMYGLKVVRHGACYKHTRLTVLCRIGLMNKIVHYSKMSKTLEKPRKSFPERWEPSQKRAGSASTTCGGNDVRRSVCFSDRPWRQHFTDPFSVYCVLPQTHTTVRISDSCPVSLPRASIQKYAACMTFLHAEWIKTAQNDA